MNVNVVSAGVRGLPPGDHSGSTWSKRQIRSRRLYVDSACFVLQTCGVKSLLSKCLLFPIWFLLPETCLGTSKTSVSSLQHVPWFAPWITVLCALPVQSSWLANCNDRPPPPKRSTTCCVPTGGRRGSVGGTVPPSSCPLMTYLFGGFSFAASGTDSCLNLLVPKEGFTELLGLALALGKAYKWSQFLVG